MEARAPTLGNMVLMFDVPLILEKSAFGAVLPAVIDGTPARVHFPGRNELLMPPAGFELANFDWGSKTSARQALINALGFSIDLTAIGTNFTLEALGDRPDSPLEQNFVRGWETLAEPTRTWLLRFQEYGGPVLRQLLTLEDPSPALIMHPSDYVLPGGCLWMIADREPTRRQPSLAL